VRVIVLKKHNCLRRHWDASSTRPLAPPRSKKWHVGAADPIASSTIREEGYAVKCEEAHGGGRGIAVGASCDRSQQPSGVLRLSNVLVSFQSMRMYSIDDTKTSVIDRLYVCLSCEVNP